MNERALMLEGGGMRNAFASGMIEGLGLVPSMFGGIFAHSSAALTAAYFLAGHTDTERVWVEELTHPNVFSYKNILSGKRPADVDYLVDVACRDLKKEMVWNHTTKLFSSVFNVITGITEYIQITENNFSEIMKATCAIPMIANHVHYNGNVYADGGTEEIFPVHRAYEDGYKKLLIIGNNFPADHVDSYGLLWQWLAFPTSARARKALRGRVAKHSQAMDFIKSPPEGVEIKMISPWLPLPAHRFERSKKKVEFTYELGYFAGIEYQEEIMSFLHGS